LEGNYEKKVQHTERGERGKKKPRLQTPTHTKRKEKEDDINNTI
jgi:hypothetical protein